MYSIQNLTNSTIKFQGITINAYGTITVSTITDYISLSRLSNCGKIRYCTVKATKKEEVVTAQPEKIKEIPVKGEVKVEEPVIEKVVEPVIEEKIETTVKDNPVENIVESVETEDENKTVALFETNTDDTAKISTYKKGRKNKK